MTDFATASRVAIYARQSEDVSEGIERQLSRCRALIEARGYTLVREYLDNDTSAAKRRGAGTAWAMMLADLAGGSADVVVAVDLDRLLRDTRDLIAIMDTGARVLTVDGEIDLTTADGEFRATMLAGIARFEIRRKSERQLRANLDRAGRGRPTPGRRRFGYETNGVTPREGEAAIVRRMFQHVADGGSIRSLVRALIADGVDPSPGRAWTPTRVRYILTNPHYSGSVTHLGRVMPSDSIVPLVDGDLAAEVRAILADSARRTTPGPARRYLMSGLATCGVCGAGMHFMRAYRCSASTAHPSITRDRLEGRIREEIARALIGGGSTLFPVRTETGAVAQLMAEHARNADAVTALLADRDEGLVPAQSARERLIALRGEREAIEKRLDEARVSKSAASALVDVAQTLLSSLPPEGTPYDDVAAAILARFDELDLDRQREIVAALLYVQVDPGRDTRRRVHIEHLLAPSLNPWEQFDAGD
jgi:site-specific DNA recombinase